MEMRNFMLYWSTLHFSNHRSVIYWFNLVILQRFTSCRRGYFHPNLSNEVQNLNFP